jgi:hypothetical protein
MRQRMEKGEVKESYAKLLIALRGATLPRMVATPLLAKNLFVLPEYTWWTSTDGRNSSYTP